MKYIILKGFEGFGDRLQSLLYCIKYALYTNRILVVDWTDYMWCSSDQENFEHYFKLENVNYISYSKFVRMYKTYNQKMQFTVFPSIWKDNVLKQPDNYMYDEKYAFNVTMNTIMTKHEKDYDEDIVVFASVQTRVYNCKLFYKYIRLQTNVINFIHKHPFYQNIIQNQKSYISIHLRGGDRMIKNNTHVFANQSYNHKNYIQSIVDKLAQQSTKIKDVLIVSDSNFLLDECQKLLSKNKKYTVHTTENHKINETNGLHKILRFDNISKEQINTQMIVDFYFLSKAKIVLNDSISNFSNIARLVRFNPCFEKYHNDYKISIDI